MKNKELSEMAYRARIRYEKTRERLIALQGKSLPYSVFYSLAHISAAAARTSVMYQAASERS